MKLVHGKQCTGAVPAPDYLAAASISPGERVFKPARTLYLAMTGLLALVRTPRAAQSAPELISSPRSDALYQGTTLQAAEKGDLAHPPIRLTNVGGM